MLLLAWRREEEEKKVKGKARQSVGIRPTSTEGKHSFFCCWWCQGQKGTHFLFLLPEHSMKRTKSPFLFSAALSFKNFSRRLCLYSTTSVWHSLRYLNCVCVYVYTHFLIVGEVATKRISAATISAEFSHTPPPTNKRKEDSSIP